MGLGPSALEALRRESSVRRESSENYTTHGAATSCAHAKTRLVRQGGAHTSVGLMSYEFSLQGAPPGSGPLRDITANTAKWRRRQQQQQQQQQQGGTHKPERRVARTASHSSAAARERAAANRRPCTAPCTASSTFAAETAGTFCTGGLRAGLDTGPQRPAPGFLPATHPPTRHPLCPSLRGTLGRASCPLSTGLQARGRRSPLCPRLGAAAGPRGTRRQHQRGQQPDPRHAVAPWTAPPPGTPRICPHGAAALAAHLL